MRLTLIFKVTEYLYNNIQVQDLRSRWSESNTRAGYGSETLCNILPDVFMIFATSDRWDLDELREANINKLTCNSSWKISVRTSFFGSALFTLKWITDPKYKNQYLPKTIFKRILSKLAHTLIINKQYRICRTHQHELKKSQTHDIVLYLKLEYTEIRIQDIGG